MPISHLPSLSVNKPKNFEAPKAALPLQTRVLNLKNGQFNMPRPTGRNLLFVIPVQRRTSSNTQPAAKKLVTALKGSTKMHINREITSSAVIQRKLQYPTMAQEQQAKPSAGRLTDLFAIFSHNNNNNLQTAQKEKESATSAIAQNCSATAEKVHQQQQNVSRRTWKFKKVCLPLPAEHMAKQLPTQHVATEQRNTQMVATKSTENLSDKAKESAQMATTTSRNDSFSSVYAVERQKNQISTLQNVSFSFCLILLGLD